MGTGPKGALFHTLQQLLRKPGKRTGWIFYNDEYPADMSPYQDKPKSFWSKFPPPRGAKLKDDAEKARLTKLMQKEGLIDKKDTPTVRQLLLFRQARAELIKEVAEIERELIAKWKKRKSDWPSAVQPNSIRAK